VTLFASSLWWVAVVDLWPGEKPYIGGSTDGTALDLVLGYNGLGRVFGNGGPGGGGGRVVSGDGGGTTYFGGAGGNAAFGGEAGASRMFGDAVGGQISWLLPLALLALVLAGIVGYRRFRTYAPADPGNRAGWVLWGGWLLVNGLVFSFQEGIFHPYYTTVMAPAIGALVGAGGVLAVRMYRDKTRFGWLVLPISVAVTAAWAWVVISRDMAWNGWLRYAVVGIAVVAIIVLVLRKFRRGAIILGLVAVLLAPAVWSGAGAFASAGNAGIPMAGPTGGLGGGGNFVLRLPPGVTSPPPGMVPPQNGPGGGPGRDSGQLTADQQKIVDYAKANAAGAEILFAVEGGAQAATSYIIATGETVVGMGGFSGRDPAPSVDQLSAWVSAGKLKFILAGGGRGGGGGGMGGPGGQSSERATWIQEHCKPVLTVGNQTLNECTA
jgi:4-amino-4-deoxy-L-arabinose transferase-like glycosyltransferase